MIWGSPYCWKHPNLQVENLPLEKLNSSWTQVRCLIVDDLQEHGETLRNAVMDIKVSVQCLAGFDHRGKWRSMDPPWDRWFYNHPGIHPICSIYHFIYHLHIATIDMEEHQWHRQIYMYPESSGPRVWNFSQKKKTPKTDPVKGWNLTPKRRV